MLPYLLFLPFPAELRWMCHLWEPMRCWYQPLGFYLFMEGAALLGALALRAGEDVAAYKQQPGFYEPGAMHYCRHCAVVCLLRSSCKALGAQMLSTKVKQLCRAMR
jgi:hypothetical protein